MKIEVLVILMFAALSHLAVSAQSTEPTRPLNAGPNERWIIRWDRSDDFNGTQIDWRKWHQNPEDFGAWTWDNQRNASVSDGVLKLTMRFQEGLGGQITSKSHHLESNYTSAMLKSFRTGCYGYYEAKIKSAPLFPGVCPAFWLYSRIDDSKVTKQAVRYSEIDVVELTQRLAEERITDHNLHTILSNGHPGIAGRDWRRPNDTRYCDAQALEYRAPFDPRDGFHTYGCQVSPQEIIWYVDRLEVGRKTNQFWHQNMNVAISLGLRAPYTVFTNNRLILTPNVDPKAFPTTMLVDYVRVWELGDQSE